MEPSELKKWCTDNCKTNDAAVLESKELKQAVLDNLCELAAEAKFNSLEKPGQLCLITEPWTQDNDMLTPTMKLKRNVAKNKLADKIEAMYKMPMMRASKK